MSGGKLMKRGLIELNKWHFKLGIVPIYWLKRGYLLHFGIFKLTSFPPEGIAIAKENYKGFWIRKEIDWKGFEINL